MNRIASIHLLESGNLEIEGQDAAAIKGDDDLLFLCRMLAVQKCWNDKRLTDLLDQFIEADMGGVGFQ